MTHSKKLLSSASILALTLTLSACGSNSNDNTDMMPTPTPPDPLEVTDNLEMLSGDAAGSVLMKATDAAKKISTLGSNGDSNVAMLNAQAVLDARMELEDAKSAAEMVLADLDDTDENRAERQLLTQAIEAAEKVLDGALETAVQMVTGDNADEPKTAEDAGKAVAAAILAAFEAPRVTRHGNGVITIPDAATTMMSSGGATFSELVDVEVTDHVLGDAAASVPTISATAKGVDITDLAAGKSSLGMAATGLEITEGGRPVTLSASFKGIMGNLYCMSGAGCEIKEDDSGVKEAVGNWVFAPNEPNSHYMANEDGEGYTEVPTVEYAYWLDVDRNGDVTIQTAYNLSHLPNGAGNNRLSRATVVNWAAGEDASATYSGKAAGLSVHQEFNPNGEVAATHSGSFTADVSLTATFGASPMLEGMVSGFEADGNPKAVDTGWEVTLEERGISGVGDFGINNAGVLGEGTVKVSDKEAGNWKAVSYTDKLPSGAPHPRPAGIFGDFNAEFTDGHAAGVYATRKDD